MFSRTVEYALRAVIHLAHESPNPRTTAQIAEATRGPKDYLAKVLQGLVKKGIVDTQRGVGGGVSLTRPPEELTILDVVNAVEPIERIGVATDEDDNRFLECATAAQAVYLITGNLRHYPRVCAAVTIVNAREFLNS